MVKTDSAPVSRPDGLLMCDDFGRDLLQTSRFIIPSNNEQLQKQPNRNIEQKNEIKNLYQNQNNKKLTTKKQQKNNKNNSLKLKSQSLSASSDVCLFFFVSPSIGRPVSWAPTGLRSAPEPEAQAFWVLERFGVFWLVLKPEFFLNHWILSITEFVNFIPFEIGWKLVRLETPRQNLDPMSPVGFWSRRTWPSVGPCRIWLRFHHIWRMEICGNENLLKTNKKIQKVTVLGYLQQCKGRATQVLYSWRSQMEKFWNQHSNRVWIENFQSKDVFQMVDVNHGCSP